MEGIKITDQELYGDEEVQKAKNKVWSIFSTEGIQLQEMQNRLKGESTLNSYEIDFFSQNDRTRIRVKYGLTTVGVILTVILLALGVVVGAILLLIWYMKMDDIKSSLTNAFPGFLPPEKTPTPTLNPPNSPMEQDDSDKTPPPPRD